MKPREKLAIGGAAAVGGLLYATRGTSGAVGRRRAGAPSTPASKPIAAPQGGTYATQAPAPPAVGWPVGTDQVLAYAAYLHTRFAEFAAAWASWHSADNWDKSGSPAGCTTAETCHPEFYDVLGKANALDQSGAAPAQIDAWLADWADDYAGMSHDTLGLEAEVQLCGAFCGPLPKLQRYHGALQAVAAKAASLGLSNVPDPGTIAAPDSFKHHFIDPNKPTPSELGGGLFVLAALVGGGLLVLHELDKRG